MPDTPGTNSIVIRTANPGDLSQVIDIYNHYVEQSHATFDVAPFSVGEKVPWFSQFTESGPHQMLVADDGESIHGWCTSTPFGSRPGYDVSVETTVYVRPDQVSNGIGRQLYEALLPRLQSTGLHGAYAAVALPNDASTKLHERMGYRKVGEYREVGYKFDRYWTVAWFEKRL
jgi:phosphinothricin acetyltransferase